jgi:class 3 adenylate cyclase
VNGYRGPEEEASGAGGGSGSATAAVLTFLIADVRGYTRFTQDNGDEEAGRLAALFAQLAREAILGDYQSHPLLGTPFDQLWVK